MTSSSEGTPPVSGPGRAADILKAFKHDAGPKRITDLSRITGLSPATVFRIANALVDTSLLARNKDKSFAPGPDLIKIASTVLAYSDAANTAS